MPSQPQSQEIKQEEGRCNLPSRSSDPDMRLISSPLPDSQERRASFQVPMSKIDQHVSAILHLVHSVQEELGLQQSRYELAYLSEQRKLAQNVEAYRVLMVEKERLDRESVYYKQDLLPQYSRLLKQMQQESQETHAKLLAWQERSSEQAELLRGQDRAIEELQSEVEQLRAKDMKPMSLTDQIPRRVQPQRSCRTEPSHSGRA